jgi:mycofactocin precursor
LVTLIGFPATCYLGHIASPPYGQQRHRTAAATGGSMQCMEHDDVVVADQTDELIEDELLVEEISIDGMCGVY